MRLRERYVIQRHPIDGYRIIDTVAQRYLDRADDLSDAKQALQDYIDENVCIVNRCNESLDDGEGYDGYCGNHADRLERQGHWS